MPRRGAPGPLQVCPRLCRAHILGERRASCSLSAALRGGALIIRVMGACLSGNPETLGKP